MSVQAVCTKRGKCLSGGHAYTPALSYSSNWSPLIGEEAGSKEVSAIAGVAALRGCEIVGRSAAQTRCPGQRRHKQVTAMYSVLLWREQEKGESGEDEAPRASTDQ